MSQRSGCEFCVAHHTAGLARHVGDEKLARDLAAASVGRGPRDVLTAREVAFCVYTHKLTQSPRSMCMEDLAALRKLDIDDATILDLNQIVAYFADVNRTVLGLGVATRGEPLGLHPNEERESFEHRQENGGRGQ